MKDLRYDLEDVLTWLYANELNCEIWSFWDGGWTFRLGDRVNGFVAEAEEIRDLAEGARWLVEEARKRYPSLAYVESP